MCISWCIASTSGFVWREPGPLLGGVRGSRNSAKPVPKRRGHGRLRGNGRESCEDLTSQGVWLSQGSSKTWRSLKWKIKLGKQCQQGRELSWGVQARQSPPSSIGFASWTRCEWLILCFPLFSQTSPLFPGCCCQQKESTASQYP